MISKKIFLSFMNLAEKLKAARKLFGDTQSVASKKSGVAQRDISYLEAGKKKYLPTEYILYLQKNGIDLNTLFDETKEMKTIGKDLSETVKELQNQLLKKDELIGLQKDAIQLREHKIQKLTLRSDLSPVH